MRGGAFGPPAAGTATMAIPAMSLLALSAGFGIALRAVDPRNFLVQHPLDRFERLDILRRHQRGGKAFAPGPAGAADAVNVVFWMDRHVVIEDVAHIRNVEAAGGDVARGEKGDVAAAEGVKRRRALMLVHVAMQAAGIEAVAQERPEQDADILLAVAEDNGVPDVALA